MVLIPVNMVISGFPLGVAVNECRPSKLDYVVSCGFLLWHESTLALEVRLLELFSNSKFPGLILPFFYGLVSESGLSSDN